MADGIRGKKLAYAHQSIELDLVDTNLVSRFIQTMRFGTPIDRLNFPSHGSLCLAVNALCANVPEVYKLTVKLVVKWIAQL